MDAESLKAKFKEAVAGLTKDQVERMLYETALERYQGNKVRAARALGVAIRTMRAKIHQFGLEQYRGYVRFNQDGTIASHIQLATGAMEGSSLKGSDGTVEEGQT